MPLRKKKDNRNSEKGKSMLRKIREDLVKRERERVVLKQEDMCYAQGLTDRFRMIEIKIWERQNVLCLHGTV